MKFSEKTVYSYIYFLTCFADFYCQIVTNKYNMWNYHLCSLFGWKIHQMWYINQYMMCVCDKNKICVETTGSNIIIEFQRNQTNKVEKQEREKKLGLLSRISPPKSLETQAPSTSGF